MIWRLAITTKVRVRVKVRVKVKVRVSEGARPTDLGDPKCALSSW